MVIRLPPKEQVDTPSVARKRKRNIDEIILSSDDESTPAVKSTSQPSKRARTGEQTSTPPPSQDIARLSPQPPRSSSQRPLQDIARSSSQPSAEEVTTTAPTPPSSQDTSRSSPQASAEATTTTIQLPTPQATPQKPKELYDQAQLADRYVAKRSTLEDVEYTNPQKFCLRPPFHVRLTGSDVDKIINQLRAQFDPIPISQELGRPVEEVKHIIDALVTNPLYDHKEAVRRNENGLAQLMTLFNEGDTQNRKWGEPNAAGMYYKGELYGVEIGSIQVTGADTGNVKSFNLSELSVEDKKYLNVTLTADEMEKLWSGSGCRTWGPKIVKDSTTGETKEKFVIGRLDSVEFGLVKISGRDSGKVFNVTVEELSQEDKNFLNVELVAEDKVKLLGGEGGFWAAYGRDEPGCGQHME